MKAQDLEFTQLIQGAKQFIIPIFQRTYSWEIGNCEELWRDIIRVGSDASLNSHFIGSAVYIPEQETSAAISRWLVIDGQQRITTITLLLLALQRQLALNSLDDPVSPEEIEDYYLKNRYGKGDQKYKLLLTKTDKESLIALIDDKDMPKLASERICENYEFFNKQMGDANLKVVYEGIQKLMIVDVRLQHGLDNPQMIFESMNSTGKALTQADLIRNFVLMGLPHEPQTRLYEEYWRPMEVEFGVKGYGSNFDEFMRYFLVVQTGNHRIRKDEVYTEFKSFSLKLGTEELLALMKEFAHYYCCLALGGEDDQDLAANFQDIKELKADVCYPLLMELYQDYKNDLISKDEFREILLLVESYVFRRVICEIPTNSLRQTFATFTKTLRKDRYLESVKAIFLLLPSYRRFPKDDEFTRQLPLRNLYAFNRRTYWLRRFENHGRKERVFVQDYTIEHIMPQNESLNDGWRESLGEDWVQIHEKYLHTLGNLTLTGYNSEYSDKPFAEKRDMDGGFRDSPLKLNEGLGKCEDWNETEIKLRAERLSKIAVNIWCSPNLPDEVVEVYRLPQKESGSGYSIGDHPYLESGHSRDLFDALRSEILALDSCVREEYLKLYVAFKAETNFVDVIPQAKKLRLTLNMKFEEIDDPRGVCQDVTNLGRWGNGCVAVTLEKQSELTHVIGLIRQSLELQLGEDVSEG